MRRTAQRPIPAGRFGLPHATIVGVLMMLGGALYLGLALNPLTGWLALATSAVYLAAYTPLKKIHPICTFVGAFPGAMPGVLGWTAARGRLEWGALVMFAIVFFWQFPHFFSIAWLYREDYEDGGIRMLPVVEPDGKSTARQILLYSLALIPVSLLPTLSGHVRLDLFRWGAAAGSGSVLCWSPAGDVQDGARHGSLEAAGTPTPAGDGVLPAAVIRADDAEHASIGDFGSCGDRSELALSEAEGTRPVERSSAVGPTSRKGSEKWGTPRHAGLFLAQPSVARRSA